MNLPESRQKMHKGNRCSKIIELSFWRCNMLMAFKFLWPESMVGNIFTLLLSTSTATPTCVCLNFSFVNTHICVSVIYYFSIICVTRYLIYVTQMHTLCVHTHIYIIKTCMKSYFSINVRILFIMAYSFFS